MITEKMRDPEVAKLVGHFAARWVVAVGDTSVGATSVVIGRRASVDGVGHAATYGAEEELLAVGHAQALAGFYHELCAKSRGT